MYLIIETATSRGLVALCQEDKVRKAHELTFGLGHSRKLEPTLDLLLREQEIKPSELEFVAVGIGPGSYTGIRVGVACAKALSYALQIPIVPLSSLQGYIPPSSFEGAFLSVIDARIGGVYLSEGMKKNGQICRLSDDSLVSFEIFLEKAKQIPHIVTPDFAPLHKRMKQELDLQVFEVGPSAEHLATLAWVAYSQKQYSLDGEVAISYLRLTQAEMEKLLNKGDQE